MKTRFLFAGAAALALAACGGDADEAATEDTAAADQTAVADEPAADPAMPTTGQEFANMVAASDMYEVEAGKLAQQNGTSQAVKDFGAMMERDHTKSTADLKTAAGEAGGVTVNAQMSAKHQADLEALRSAGDNFDSVYKEQQVAAHTQALALLRNFADNGDAQPLKDFAGKTATAVEGHLTEARELP
jgi:putative membrane protein